MRESKREKENWVSFSLLPGAQAIVQVYGMKYGAQKSCEYKLFPDKTDWWYSEYSAQKLRK